MSRTRFLPAAILAVLIAGPGVALSQTAAPAAQVAAQGDLMDTLRLSGKFTTLVAGIDATNLAGLLKSNASLTVFAPTDAAFAAMPAAGLNALKVDKTAMQKFILHHVVNAPFLSTRIKGVKGPIPSGAGDMILLDGSDEAGTLKVDGATIIQADLKTASGLLQIVDRVLISGQGAVEPLPSAAITPANP